jgi:hypothetical protein
MERKPYPTDGVLSVTSLDLSHELPADVFRHPARSPKGYNLWGHRYRNGVRLDNTASKRFGQLPLDLD